LLGDESIMADSCQMLRWEVKVLQREYQNRVLDVASKHAIDMTELNGFRMINKARKASRIENARSRIKNSGL
jgi:hypothetical protein